jgi:LysM repeat protein
LRGIGNALVVALISVGLMIGALSISLVEFVPQLTPTAGGMIPSPIPLTVTNTLPPTLTPTLGLESPTPTITPTSTITSTPPASCLPPSGWGQIVIQAGDTLDSIATRYRTSKEELRSANCLLIDSLVAGAILYAPPVATITSVVCVQGAAGWAKSYMVKPGDTFFGIGFNYYTSANQLKTVNCRISDRIYVGEMLWVPNVATRTPPPTPLPGSTVTPVAYPTDSLTETALPLTATVIPFTATTLPFTATILPSNTPIPVILPEMLTVTAIPTLTPSPTAFPAQ